jgi:hypothetical protein
MSAVESKPASGGRIKTSHFFPLNRSEMFWQEGDLRFFEQSGGNELGFDGFKLIEVRQKGLRLMPESEVTSEQESSAKDGNLFSAERNQLKVETE